MVLIEGIEELFNLLSQTLIRLEQVCFDLRRNSVRLVCDGGRLESVLWVGFRPESFFLS